MQIQLSSSNVSVDTTALNRAAAERVQYFNFFYFGKKVTVLIFFRKAH